MTIEQIQQQIIADKDTRASLTPLTATGDGMIWWTWTWVVATVIWLQQANVRVLLSDIGRAGNAIQYATLNWYVDMAKTFQMGYNLEWNDVSKRYEYSIIDNSSRVVKFASMSEVASGVSILKIAKDNNGVPAPLLLNEYLAFQSFIQKLKIPGTFINVISENADIAKLAMTIYYNPQIDVLTVRNDVELAIMTYFKSLPFDATFRTLHLIDAIQYCKGVIDVANLVVEMKWGTNAFVTVNHKYVSFAGHITIDPNTPLSASINYIPEV